MLKKHQKKKYILIVIKINNNVKQLMVKKLIIVKHVQKVYLVNYKDFILDLNVLEKNNVEMFLHLY